MKFWLGVVSREHALTGINGEFAQVCHGKKGPLSRMKQGDWFIIYSPKEYFQEKTPCQKFVGIGTVKTGNVYQFDMGNNFKPFRIDIAFVPCNEVEIRPLINDLTFIKNKTNWGMAFRFGHLEIPQADFALIAQRMGINFNATHINTSVASSSTQAVNDDEKEVAPRSSKKLKLTNPTMTGYDNNGLLKATKTPAATATQVNHPHKLTLRK